jgi:hypothetical protein
VNHVAILPPSERAALFGETAARMGVATRIVEKDFWVCFTLLHLFGLRFRPALLFKGGTSLSKAFHLIDRFSEDIDLALDRTGLGFGGAEDPLVLSGKSRRRQIDKLAAACGSTVRERLEPALRAALGIALGPEGWALECASKEDEQVDLLFRYPQTLPPEDYGALSYVGPHVVMEIGARSDQEPSLKVAITSYAAEQYPDYFRQPEATVRVLASERTFWEKATILHAENGRPVEGDGPRAWTQISRHAYDLFMMERRGVAERALERLDLLEAVARHKRAFFSAAWAGYENAQPGSIRLVPRGEFARAVERDYAAMRPMFFGAPPSFEEIMKTLEELEKRLNGRG